MKQLSLTNINISSYLFLIDITDQSNNNSEMRSGSKIFTYQNQNLKVLHEVKRLITMSSQTFNMCWEGTKDKKPTWLKWLGLKKKND